MNDLIIVDCLSEVGKDELLVDLPSGGVLDLGMDNIVIMLKSLVDVVPEEFTVNEYSKAYIDMYFDDIGGSND